MTLSLIIPALTWLPLFVDRTVAYAVADPMLESRGHRRFWDAAAQLARLPAGVAAVRATGLFAHHGH